MSLRFKTQVVGLDATASDRWYVTNGTQAVGPIKLDLLVRGIEAGRVPTASFVRHDTWKVWRPVSDFTVMVESDGTDGSLPRFTLPDGDHPLDALAHPDHAPQTQASPLDLSAIEEISAEDAAISAGAHTQPRGTRRLAPAKSSGENASSRTTRTRAPAPVSELCVDEVSFDDLPPAEGDWGADSLGPDTLLADALMADRPSPAVPGLIKEWTAEAVAAHSWKAEPWKDVPGFGELPASEPPPRIVTRQFIPDAPPIPRITTPPSGISAAPVRGQTDDRPRQLTLAELTDDITAPARPMRLDERLPSDALAGAKDLHDALVLVLSATVHATSADAALLHRVADEGAVVICAHGPEMLDMLGVRTRLLDPTVVAAFADRVVFAEPEPGSAGRSTLERLRALGPTVTSAMMLPIRPDGRLLGFVELGRAKPLRARDLANVEEIIAALVHECEAKCWHHVDLDDDGFQPSA